MKYVRETTTDYMFRLRKAQKVNEACNGILTTQVVQENGMKIFLPIRTTGFETIQDYEKKEVEKPGEEMLCAILYIGNSDKARFSDLKKRVENNYVLNKTHCPRTVNAVYRLLLN